ncbi:PAS domain S-box protein [Iocasia frigidifontis]|uniref:HTH-type transcriptional regulatory protein TyrR n=1 Tax=Iocasia fonsfrigidae TaxID=2682810 RepID=A0A8A7KC45_9FIRM|nr:sigma 54-interacting transcriptional regulator [Iocasia fonsfrigidae]QTL99021.1 PAS domain S-box protein [Iocasia fonsfrigidae]
MADPVNLIRTIEDRCHECYACVRNCPAKAVRVKDGQAEVLGDRCIHCGNCVRVCSQGAKKVRDETAEVRKLLAAGERVIAGIAPSFPSYEVEGVFTADDWIAMLYSIGFAEVYEVAWGAQLIIEEYSKLLKTKADKPLISSACPVIVNLIQKHYPQLVENLVPIVSPMMALYRYIKLIEGPDAKVVMIGPCLAKKGEFNDLKDCFVLTFSEINSLKGFKVPESKEKDLDTAVSRVIQPTDEARALPLAGGLLTAVSSNYDRSINSFLKVEGSQKVFELFNSLLDKEISPEFVDILFCDGCINGVDLAQGNYFKKERAVDDYINNQALDRTGVYSWDKIGLLDLSTSFQIDYKELDQPLEKEIWRILAQTGKYDESDLLDCGACGYSSCREKAVAVYQGLAEVEMCLPYLLSEKRTEIKRVQELNRELDTLINTSYDGMIMVNKKGEIERVNEAYLSLLGLSKEEILHKNVLQLEEERYIYPSVSRLCLREKREITLIQNTKNGQRLLTTGSPLLDNAGDVLHVVANTRNLSELNKLNESSNEKEKLREYLQGDINHDNDDNLGHIIANSVIMENILNLARKISNTDSSVLLMGESGVGKEVIARYIHEQSQARDVLVKINCAAIPESLLESELFGYETGAFSGAKREGKQGLIEKADGGTLFLDEIGEMPLNMQAKLLQVLQEHSLTRIGGIEAIKVDFRLITATNKNLKEMVEKNCFREDLYYRLNVVPITIPPLRKRPEDILALVRYFLNLFNNKYGKDIKLNDDLSELLLDYDWPGNVREVANLLERVVVTADGGLIDKDFLERFIEFERINSDTEVEIKGIIPLQDAVSQLEKKLLILAREKGKTTYDMAEMLGVNQSTIVRKLKKYFS